MFGSVRSYSSSALGHIRSKNNVISVLAPIPKSQIELFADLKQNERPAVFEKVQSALLWEQLNAANRKLMFRENKSSSFDTAAPEHIDLKLGTTTRQIEFVPRKYLGPPSKQDYRVLVSTSRSQEDLHEALDFVGECLKTKSFAENFQNDLTKLALVRAAAAGNFQDIYQYMVARLPALKPFLCQDFYSEALRIYALRVPHLSRRSKAMLTKLHSRANVGIGRELGYAYGLTQYGAKFGYEYAPQLQDTIRRIQELLPSVLQRPQASMRAISQVDLVLAHEAMKQCQLPGAEEVVQSIEQVMVDTARDRPLSEALVVSLEDSANDGAEEETSN